MEVAYKPTITIGQPHPSPVIESGLLSSVPLPPLAYDALALPPDAISQGKLSSLQLESILYAGQRHRLVQHGVRAGFFLEDTPDEALLVSPGESAMPRLSFPLSRFSAPDALSLNLALVLFLRVFALDCSNIETSIPA